jgi:putative N-acetylmannosamine-6-phosphate epimerase
MGTLVKDKSNVPVIGTIEVEYNNSDARLVLPTNI